MLLRPALAMSLEIACASTDQSVDLLIFADNSVGKHFFFYYVLCIIEEHYSAWYSSKKSLNHQKSLDERQQVYLIQT
jgi:hypothetical protein